MRLDTLKFAVLVLLTLAFSGVAVAAQHEKNAVSKIKTVQIVATGSRYEPLQYITPYSQSRHVSDYKLTITWNPVENQAREDWNLNTIYPFPAALTFHAVYHEQRGERVGRDGFRPSTEGPVAPARIGAVFKDLWLTNPTILAAQAEVVSGAPLLRDGVEYENRVLSAHDTRWNFLVDKTTGLPAEVSTIENDPLEVEVTNRVVFSDWREVAGVQFPFKLVQYVDEKVIRREIRQSITVNAAGDQKKLELTAGHGQEADQDLRQWGWSMSNFFTRRMSMGAPSDQDQSKVVKFTEVGEGIYQITGSSHHNLLIVGPDGLAIVDAVWYPRRSEAILRELDKRWPGKPLKYVILTHHHIDHTGGLLSYAKAGATVVTGENNNAYFNRLLSKVLPNTPELIAVQGKTTLAGIGRAIEVYPILAGHADGFIAPYVPDAKLLFNADMYSPGRPTQKTLWVKELLDAVEFYDIDVKTHVGGHGNGSKPHQDLIELAGAK